MEPIDHWRNRLKQATELMDALQAGQVVGSRWGVREKLVRLKDDPKWEVRKVLANHLSLLDDALFDELAVPLLNDPNSYVRRSAERSVRMRRSDARQADRREKDDRQLARRLSQLESRYGEEVAGEVIALSQLRFHQMAGSIAHDLRSILTHLQPAAKGLHVAHEADLALSRKSLRVVEGLSILERCIGDMELYTEPLAIQRHPEDLKELLTVAIEMARKNVEEMGYNAHMVIVHLQVPDGQRFRVSRHLLILVVANLLKNSFESFMDQDLQLRRGDIYLEVRTGNQGLEIIIRDTGMGMSPENLAELRTLIPRRRNKAKRKSTGFGVPIAHRYVEAHGGRLTFDSREEEGTTVTIALPEVQENGESGDA